MMAVLKHEKTNQPEMASLADDLRKMQLKMSEAQAELQREIITVTSGEKLVKVVISGSQQVQSIQLSSELMQSGDPEFVSEILTTAVNDAIVQSQTLAARRLETIRAGLGLPGT